MKQSESIAKLAPALVKAQAEMGGAVKDSANPFFKSKYADLMSVVKAVKEPFANHGLAYTQLPISSESGIGVATRLIHESGEWLESEFTMPMVKSDPQSAGSTLTYARRYALQALAGIPTADDDAGSAMLRSVEDDLSGITAQLNAAEGIDQLQATFKMAWNAFPKSRAELTAIKDAKKKELTNDSGQ